MKNIIVLLISVCVLCFVSYAEVTTNDVTTELESQETLEWEVILSGLYTVGLDIKPGLYDFVLLENDERFGGTHIGLYESEEEFRIYSELHNDVEKLQESYNHQLLGYSMSKKGAGLTIRLKEGMYLTVYTDADNLRIRPSTSPFQP